MAPELFSENKKSKYYAFNESNLRYSKRNIQNFFTRRNILLKN